MFAQTESRIQTLTKLGLTQYQGRVLLALAELGTATAKDITRTTGIPRPKVYEALDKLQELGIVNKIITTPATYEAIPLSDAIPFLMKRKINDYQNLCSETSNLLRDYGEKHRNASLAKEPKIVLVSAKKAIVDCVQRLMEESEVTIDLVVSGKPFSKTSLFSNTVIRTQNRGVKMRVVVQRPRNGIPLSKHISSFGLPSFAEYRTRPFPPEAVIGLFDGKHVLICTKADTELGGSPAIMTDNVCLVEIAKAYFEKMWLTSQLDKEKPKQSAEII